jgi:hypothetical protein
VQMSGRVHLQGLWPLLGIVGCGVFRLRRTYVVSAHSWRILFTQTFGGMSSMPSWPVPFEICRWSASSAWSLKSRSRRA